MEIWNEVGHIRTSVLDLTGKAEFTKLAAKAILANQERGNRDVCWGEGWHAKVNQGLQKGQGLGWGAGRGRKEQKVKIVQRLTSWAKSVSRRTYHLPEGDLPKPHQDERGAAVCRADQAQAWAVEPESLDSGQGSASSATDDESKCHY